MADGQNLSDMILTVISVVAPAFTVLVTIGGIANEYSTKDNDGNRRITRAGKIAMGLAACGLLATLATNIWKSYQDGQQKDRAIKEAAAAASLAEQKRANEARKFAEETQWKDFSEKYNAALTALSMRETQKQAAGVISNQKVLAAIEKTRDDLKTAYLADHTTEVGDFVTKKINLEDIRVNVFMTCKGSGNLPAPIPNYFGKMANIYIDIEDKDIGRSNGAKQAPHFIGLLHSETYEPARFDPYDPAVGYEFKIRTTFKEFKSVSNNFEALNNLLKWSGKHATGRIEMLVSHADAERALEINKANPNEPRCEVILKVLADGTELINFPKSPLIFRNQALSHQYLAETSAITGGK